MSMQIFGIIVILVWVTVGSLLDQLSLRWKDVQVFLAFKIWTFVIEAMTHVTDGGSENVYKMVKQEKSTTLLINTH